MASEMEIPSIIELQDIDIKLTSSPHQDIPDDCKIFAQIICHHYIFAQTVSVDSAGEGRGNWKLRVNCKIPLGVQSFCIAILREGPPTITRLLGTVGIEREILVKTSNMQQNPIVILLDMVKVNSDGPSVIVNTTFSLLRQEESDLGASEAIIMLPRLGKFSLKPSLSAINQQLQQMYESVRRDEEVDMLNISTMHERLLLVPSSRHHDKARLLSILGDILSVQRKLREINNLHRAVLVYGDAVRESESNHDSNDSYWKKLGISLINRFESLGDLSDLNLSVHAFEQAVALTPDGHPSKVAYLNNLGSSLFNRFERLGDLSDLNRSVQVLEQTVALAPDGHPSKAAWLNNLGTSLSNQFERLGNLSDLNRSVQVKEHAVELTPDDHPAKASRFSSLGTSLSIRFERIGDLSDLNRSVQLKEQAVELLPDDHPDKPLMLSNLGNSLAYQFERLGDLSDLNRSVQVKQQAVELTLDGHPDKALFFSSLGISLSKRFKRLGDLSDLSRSVQVKEQALALTPDGHPDKAERFNNLGVSLTDQFERLGDLSDLNRSIQVLEQALALTPDIHPHKASWLSNLGMSLSIRFQKLEDLSNLNRSVQVFEQAVALAPDGHPSKAAWFSNLGGSLSIRFHRLGDLSDLNRSVHIFKEAVALCPDGHPDKATMFSNLGISLVTQFENCRDAEVMQAAISSYSSAALYSSGPLRVRFPAAQFWMKHAQLHAPNQAIESCEVAMSLIPQLMSLGAAITDWHYQIQAAGITARDAAGVAAAAGRYGTALEWLEQGRSLVWNQLLQFHSPMDDLKQAHPELASKLQSLSLQLEDSTTHTMSSNHQDPIHQNYHELALQHESLLHNIREQKGFERFLLHKTISELRPAAKGGCIVLLNARNDQIDALILHQDLDVIHLPLPLDAALKFFNQKTDFNRHRYTIMKPADSEDAPSPLVSTLSAIWHTIASRVLDRLQITTPITPGQSIPRIWWCPTGDLSFLPIHAAGIYPNGPKLADFVVSSYTPTISALLDASHMKSVTPSRLLIVSLPNQAGLPATKREVQCITQHASGISVHELCENAANAGSVSAEMVQAEWAHFACHGKQDPSDPTQSSLQLANHSKLRLSDIINLRLENAQLAFLSACETATGDEKLQDEAVHLAAGMLLAGYRGVIATMRAVDDEYAADIADETYRRLFEDYGADFTKAAEALHFAVQKVREESEAEGDFSLNWVPFIHMGI